MGLSQKDMEYIRCVENREIKAQDAFCDVDFDAPSIEVWKLMDTASLGHYEMTCMIRAMQIDLEKSGDKLVRNWLDYIKSMPNDKMSLLRYFENLDNPSFKNIIEKHFSNVMTSKDAFDIIRVCPKKDVIDAVGGVALLDVDDQFHLLKLYNDSPLLIQNPSFPAMKKFVDWVNDRNNTMLNATGFDYGVNDNNPLTKGLSPKSSFLERFRTGDGPLFNDPEHGFPAMVDIIKKSIKTGLRFSDKEYVDSFRHAILSLPFGRNVNDEWMSIDHTNGVMMLDYLTDMIESLSSVYGHTTLSRDLDRLISNCEKQHAICIESCSIDENDNEINLNEFQL